MKRKIFSILFVLVLMVSFSLVAAVPVAAVDGTDWYVDGAGTDDGSHGIGTGADAFKTIQYAIDDTRVATGDTIQVAAGIYSSATNGETFPINVTKAVTIESSGTAAETILDVGGGSATGVVLKAAATLDGFTINNASNLAINIYDNTEGGQLRTRAINNVINGAKLKIGNHCSEITVQGNIIDGGKILIQYGDSDILIKGNTVSNFTTGYGIDMYPGTGVLPSGPVNSNVVVEDNVLDNCNYGIVQSQGFTSTLTIRRNKVSNATGIGIAVWDGSNITIENNEVHGCTDDVYGCGICVAGQAITMRYNKVYNNNAKGVSIGWQAGATGVVVNYNNIYGNTNYGLSSVATETVDATNNWWGSANGPGQEGANDVSGDVNYTPWLTTTWPPPPDTVWVDDGFTDADNDGGHEWGIDAFAIIQDGIDNVAPSGTVNVAAGIYEEEIKIFDKGLTLLGAQADEPIVNGERAGDESVIRGKGTAKYGGSYRVVWIQHSDVVINGFTIESGKCIVQMQGLGAGISNISISYNYIENSSRTEGFHAGISRANSVANVTIDHNYIASNPGRGIVTNGGATTITDNTFYGNGKGIDFMGGDPYDDYFSDYAEPNYPTIISGNTFTDDSTSILLRLDECHQSITITGNDITGARNDAIRTWNVYDKDLVNPAIHYNNIVGSTNFGINNPVTGVNLDATLNWWGTTVESQIEAMVSGDVNYSPWLGAAVGTTPMTWYTNDSIQEAIDVADTGDTINVVAGTYTEDLLFDGDEAANIIIKGATGVVDDVILDGCVKFEGSTTGLTFDTIKFKAVASNELFWTQSLGTTQENLTVKNCHIVRETADGVFRDMSNAVGDNFHFINNIVENFEDAWWAVLYFETVGDPVTTGWKINDNKFVNCGGTAIAVLDQNGIEVKNNIIDYSGVTMNSQTWGGIQVALGRDISNPNPILIEGNTVIGPGKEIHTGGGGNEFAGISVCCWENEADANATIKGNTITDCWRGISVTIVSGVTIEDNDVSGCTAGISPEGVCNNIVNSGNDLFNNDVGLLFPDDGTSMYGTAYSNPDGDNVFHFDNIVGNTDYGIQNLTGVVVDATLNWWGSAIKSQIADLVSGNVAYSPWLDAAYPGGQSTSLDVTTISLASGWNLISLPLIPKNPAIKTVLDGIPFQRVAAYSPFQDWKYYNLPPIPSDLTQMNDGWGYWIDVSTAGTLTIRGYELCAPPPAVPPSYNLVEGWNLIGFKSLASDTNVATYLGTTVIVTMEAMYGYDAAAGLYTIILDSTKLVPGDGYWLAVSADGTIYP